MRLAEILDHVRDVLSAADIEVDRAIVFGSAVRGDHAGDSDIDLIVVSSDFEGIPGARRRKPIRDEWAYDEFGPVDIIEYTPEEYRSYREREGGLIDTAEAEGVRII